jgi:glycerol-3-phosphate dehydrogenase
MIPSIGTFIELRGLLNIKLPQNLLSTADLYEWTDTAKLLLMSISHNELKILIQWLRHWY